MAALGILSFSNRGEKEVKSPDCARTGPRRPREPRTKSVDGLFFAPGSVWCLREDQGRGKNVRARFVLLFSPFLEGMKIQ